MQAKDAIEKDVEKLIWYIDFGLYIYTETWRHIFEQYKHVKNAEFNLIVWRTYKMGEFTKWTCGRTSC